MCLTDDQRAAAAGLERLREAMGRVAFRAHRVIVLQSARRESKTSGAARLRQQPDVARRVQSMCEGVPKRLNAARIATIMDAIEALTADLTEEQTGERPVRGGGESRSPRVRALHVLIEDNFNALVDQLRSEAVPTRTPPRW